MKLFRPQTGQNLRNFWAYVVLKFLIKKCSRLYLTHFVGDHLWEFTGYIGVFAFDILIFLYHFLGRWNDIFPESKMMVTKMFSRKKRIVGNSFGYESFWDFLKIPLILYLSKKEDNLLIKKTVNLPNNSPLRLSQTVHTLASYERCGRTPLVKILQVFLQTLITLTTQALSKSLRTLMLRSMSTTTMDPNSKVTYCAT